jgi:hypothetical protein
VGLFAKPWRAWGYSYQCKPMVANTFDPSKQLAGQRPLAPLSGAPATGLFSAGWGLLTKRQFLPSDADERTITSIEALHALAARQHGGFVSQRGLIIDDIELPKFTSDELLRTLLTLRKEPVMVLAKTVEPQALERDVLPFLMAVRRCIEAEQLSAARGMFEVASAQVLNNPLVARLRSLVAPPVVRRVEKQDVDRNLEYEWLRTESHKYRGQWVALQGEHLVAMAPTLRELRENLWTLTLIHAPLIHRIE